MRGRLKEWATQNPLKAGVALTATFVALTIMWTVVALGPDSLLSSDCSELERSCVESHSSAAIWAVVSGVFALVFAGATLRVYLKTRGAQPPESADDR
jgi:hypothetical protein